MPYTRWSKNPLGDIWYVYVLLTQRTSLDHIGIDSMGEIFLAGVVILLLIVMAEEFFEAYDEWRNSDEDDL